MFFMAQKAAVANLANGQFVAWKKKIKFNNQNIRKPIGSQEKRNILRKLGKSVRTMWFVDG